MLSGYAAHGPGSAGKDGAPRAESWRCAHAAIREGGEITRRLSGSWAKRWPNRRCELAPRALCPALGIRCFGPSKAGPAHVHAAAAYYACALVAGAAARRGTGARLPGSLQVVSGRGGAAPSRRGAVGGAKQTAGESGGGGRGVAWGESVASLSRQGRTRGRARGLAGREAGPRDGSRPSRRQGEGLGKARL